jgi:hypothetical protein
MPYIDFSAIREVVTIKDALRALGYQLVQRWSNGRLRGRCPLCQSDRGRTRPFFTTPAKRLWQCFKCGQKGDVTELWAAAHHTSRYTAALELCRLFGCEVPTRKDA